MFPVNRGRIRALFGFRIWVVTRMAGPVRPGNLYPIGPTRNRVA